MVNKLRIMQERKTVHSNKIDKITHDPQRQLLEISI